MKPLHKNAKGNLHKMGGGRVVNAAEIKHEKEEVRKEATECKKATPRD